MFLLKLGNKTSKKGEIRDGGGLLEITVTGITISE